MGSLLGMVLVLDPICFSGWNIHDLDTTYDEGGQQDIVLAPRDIELTFY
jgi:hypothetical protein